MNLRSALLSATLIVLALATLAPVASADELFLKNGQVYSGKFIRGDASFVEFRTQGRIEAFKTTDVSQIIFKTPELGAPSEPAARPSVAQPPEPSTAPTAARTPSAQSEPAAAPAGAQSERPVLTRRPAAEAEPQARQVPPQVAPGPSVTFPAGTSVTIRTLEPIDTDRNKIGDIFTASLEDPLTMDNQPVIPRGAEVKGRIAYAQESGRLSGKSELVLELTEIKANGRTHIVRTADYTEAGVSRGRRSAATIGGGAAVGAIIGAIAGGGKGAAVGATTGAAAGTAVQVLTKGQTLKIPAETILDFKLQSPLTVEVP